MKTTIRKKNTSLIDQKEEQRDLVWQLKECPDTPQAKRVEKILELFSTLGTAKTGKGQVLFSLRNALRRYKWVSYVAPTPVGYCEIKVPADRETLSKDEAWEYAAVGMLLNIIPSIGERPRVDRCEECNDWFFRDGRNDKRWCDNICKQRHYEKDPVTRAKKLKAMRDGRIREKKRDRKSKAAVGYTKRPKRKARTR